MRNQISNIDKERIIAAHRRHEDYTEIARHLGIARGTAYAIIRRAERNGAVSLPRGGAHNRRLDGDMEDAIVSITEEHPEFTLAQINAELRRQFPHKPTVCDNTIATSLNGRLITLKLMRDVPTQRNSPEVKAQRKAMAQWLLSNATTEKIYIDESGFRLWIRRGFGRAPRGTPAYRTVNSRQSGHMSVIFAVSNERGLVHHSFKEGGFRGTQFKEFIEECSLQFSNIPVAFIFDNAPSHNSASTASLQLSHSYRFQPPYSPFLNICEGAFSVWKAAFKRLMAEIRYDLLQQEHQQRLASMMQMAEQSVSSVTITKVRQLYQHSLTLLPACLAEDDINHES